jgi:hypothetical protein
MNLIASKPGGEMHSDLSRLYRLKGEIEGVLMVPAGPTTAEGLLASEASIRTRLSSALVDDPDVQAEFDNSFPPLARVATTGGWGGRDPLDAASDAGTATVRLRAIGGWLQGLIDTQPPAIG